MIRQITLTTIFIWAMLQSFAQVSLSVYTSSAEDGTVIPFVEIEVANQLDFKPAHIIAQGISDFEGAVKFSVQPGKYYIRLRHVRYFSIIDSFSTEKTPKLYYQLHEQTNDLEDAVVTVQYKKQSAEKAVERILVLDEKDLQSRSVVNLKEALIQQMNVQIRNDNSTGSSMSMMGISGQNVKILIDGVPVIGRLDGNIDLSQINLSDVERIEVIEGPVSTNYGSNALAGVINIITKKSANIKPQFVLDAYYESIGQYNQTLTISKKIKKTSFRLNAGRNFFAGWTPGDSGRWDLWKPKEQYFGRLQVNRKFGNVQVGFKSEIFKETMLNKGKPLSPYYEKAFDEHFYTLRSDQKITADWEISKEANLSGFVATNFYNRQRLKYFRDLVTLEELPVNADGGSDTTGLVAFMSRATYSRIPKNHRLSYQTGYDVVIERGSGIRIKDGVQTMTDAALFTTAEYQANSNLTIKPGLRVAYNSSFKTPVVPMISGRYKKGNYTYRTSFSQGFRAPDIKELYIEFVDINHNVIGNTDLKAETSNHLLLSVDGKHIYKKFIFKPTVTAFYNDIQDKITLASMAPNQYTYVNISEFKSTGGNIRMNIVTEGFAISMGYSLTGVKTNLSETNPDFNFYNEFNGNIRKTWKKINFNLFAKYNGAQNIYTIDAENAAVTQRFTGAYTLMDFQAGRSFNDEKIRLQIGVKNLLNVTNINNVTQSTGAHGSDANYMAVATGRNLFIKFILQPK